MGLVTFTARTRPNASNSGTCSAGPGPTELRMIFAASAGLSKTRYASLLVQTSPELLGPRQVGGCVHVEEGGFGVTELCHVVQRKSHLVN